MAQHEHFRHEQDREDLLVEAKALVARASVRLASGSRAACGDGHALVGAEVVVGFRRDDSLAIYFAADRVYQFTSTGKLRRAFLGDMMYKADRGVLVSLRRSRTEHAVELVSRGLDSNETAEFLGEMQGYLAELLRRLSANQYELIGQVSVDGDVVERVIVWLTRYAAGIRVADSPRAK